MPKYDFFGDVAITNFGFAVNNRLFNSLSVTFILDCTFLVFWLISLIYCFRYYESLIIESIMYYIYSLYLIMFAILTITGSLAYGTSVVELPSIDGNASIGVKIGSYVCFYFEIFGKSLAAAPIFIIQFVVHGTVYLVDIQKHLFISKLSSETLAPRLMNARHRGQPANSDFLIKQQSDYNIKFWKKCMEFVDDSQERECKYNNDMIDNTCTSETTIVISKDEDRLIRLCCINFIVLKYSQYDRDQKYGAVNKNVKNYYHNSDNARLKRFVDGSGNINDDKENKDDESKLEIDFEISETHDSKDDSKNECNKNELEAKDTKEEKKKKKEQKSDELVLDLKVDINGDEKENKDQKHQDLHVRKRKNSKKLSISDANRQITTYKDYTEYIDWLTGQSEDRYSIGMRSRNRYRNSVYRHHTIDRSIIDKRLSKFNLSDLQKRTDYKLRSKIMNVNRRDIRFSNFIENSAYFGYSNICTLNDLYQNTDIGYFTFRGVVLRYFEKWIPIVGMIIKLFGELHDDEVNAYLSARGDYMKDNNGCELPRKKNNYYTFRMLFHHFFCYVITLVFSLFHAFLRVCVPMLYLLYFFLCLIEYVIYGDDNKNGFVFIVSNYSVCYLFLCIFCVVMSIYVIRNNCKILNTFYYMYYICPGKRINYIFVPFNYVEKHYQDIIYSRFRIKILESVFGNDIGMIIEQFMPKFDRYYCHIDHDACINNIEESNFNTITLPDGCVYVAQSQIEIESKESETDWLAETIQTVE